MGHLRKSWDFLLRRRPDVALLQEASQPSSEFEIRVDDAPWVTPTPDGGTFRKWRTAVVGASPNLQMEWFRPVAKLDGHADCLEVGIAGTLAAARVDYPGVEPFIAVSVYGLWEQPHPSIKSSWIYADGSVHRLISDLSALIGRQYGHRILVSGDLNILHGHGEGGSHYWANRYATIFDRMNALGFDFVGPQAPNGRQAHPWPDELPSDSKNVPTFHTNHQTPETATRQLDFVFASKGFSDQLQVRALNDPMEWGPSDHCRIEIQIGSGNNQHQVSVQ